MIRLFFRLLGYAFFGLGLVLLAGALAPLIDGGAFDGEPLGTLWFNLDSGSLNATQAFVQRYLFPALWDGIRWILVQPAYAFFLIVGFILMLVTPVRSGRRRR